MSHFEILSKLFLRLGSFTRAAAQVIQFRTAHAAATNDLNLLHERRVHGEDTLNADAVPPVWNLIASVDAINIKKRPAAVFGSYGWSGEAVPAIVARLTALKLNVVGEGLKAYFVPGDADLSKAFELGAVLAQSIA